MQRAMCFQLFIPIATKSDLTQFFYEKHYTQILYWSLKYVIETGATIFLVLDLFHDPEIEFSCFVVFIRLLATFISSLQAL